jgi:hypothetical protein
VVTSYPQRWNRDQSGQRDELDEHCDRNDITNVHSSIERRLLGLGRALRGKKLNASHVAQLIVNECSGILFDIDKHREKWLQVREIYEEEICSVVGPPPNE